MHQPQPISKIELLGKLIAESIASEPYELDGFLWAVHPQEWYCSELGISVETLRRWISKPPFVRQCKQINGKKMTLLREGEPGPMTHRHIANIMSNIFRTKTSNKVGPREYGCLIGLAEIWPAGEQVEIFKTVITDWTSFMSCVHCVIMEMQDAGEDAVKRYYSFPSITVMRRFHEVGVELHLMKLQAKVKIPSHSSASHYFSECPF
jgi:hypothetical protein